MLTQGRHNCVENLCVHLWVSETGLGGKLTTFGVSNYHLILLYAT